jgi:simple sugar transport system substrate-binding protein/ribose transport system substrate-binding protein
LISDDGVPFEMCDIAAGTVSASQSQPANLYAQYALTYALDAAKGVKLKVGEKGGGAPKLQDVSYDNDSNLADPIVAPFVTKTAVALKVTPVDGLTGSTTTTPVSNTSLWGNAFGASHGGVCNAS